MTTTRANGEIVARGCKDHQFSEPFAVGGGIVRVTCSRCGAVHLDLARHDVLADSGLFQPGRSKWMAWEPDVAQPVRYERTFGKAVARRRRPHSAVA
ncbi:MAG: hypothetical protein WAM81_11390 [Acidimicrobiia bacterium]